MVCIHRDLFQLLRGYASLTPPNRLQYPSHLQTRIVHDFLLEHILLSPHFEQYPASSDYQKSFWKWVISRLEQTDPELEVDVRIYDLYLKFLNSPSGSGVSTLSGPNPPSQSYVTHFWKVGQHTALGDSVELEEYQTTTLLESRTMIEAGTTGLRTWLASFVQAQYLIHNPALVQGKRILELGAGIGFLGIIVGSLQLHGSSSESDTSSPGAIWMSDVNESVLSRCKDNFNLACNLSSTHPNMRCCFLDWSAALIPDGVLPLTSLLNDEIDADLVLGSDIVFDPDLIPSLVAVLCIILQGHNRTAIIALTTRNPTTMGKFTRTVADRGLVLETLDFRVKDWIFMESLEFTGDTTSVSLYRITGKE
ncbi:protein-lysine N-methyltransferase EFM3 [Favolaschia claudopus]|uniref:Protein-lysine N-methyltransferase EFM3 n=1 Tax=Favolaschia claudopus TaxID=2862362 RepID=A0AAW0EGS0_9AGAR